MKWITRERPKIDRIACPWLIRRFIDPDAEFLFVPPEQVLEIAERQSAIPYDVPDVELSHVGPLCSFDAFLSKYGLSDDGLAVLAPIVRGADTGRPDLAPEAPVLLAVSLGLSQCFADDHEMLEHGMVMYDALYAWARRARTASRSCNRPSMHFAGVSAAGPLSGAGRSGADGGRPRAAEAPDMESHSGEGVRGPQPPRFWKAFLDTFLSKML